MEIEDYPKFLKEFSKVKKSVKKVWLNANLTKLEKKYEDLAKTLEDFKADKNLTGYSIVDLDSYFLIY